MVGAFSIVKKVNFTVRSEISQYPRLSYLYQPYIIWGQLKRRLKHKNLNEGVLSLSTEVMIDGCQGSANSFATSAFKLAQTRDVNVLNHRHAPYLMIQASELNIPVLLTIREPLATALSLTSRWTYVSVSQALRHYIGFYTCLLPYAHDFVVSDFEDTTRNLDGMIELLNLKFGTDFVIVDMDSAIRHCRDSVIDSAEAASERKLVKEFKRNEFSTSRTGAALLEKANLIYAEYQKIAVDQKDQILGLKS